jgi:hypothetical protein
LEELGQIIKWQAEDRPNGTLQEFVLNKNKFASVANLEIGKLISY